MSQAQFVRLVMEIYQKKFFGLILRIQPCPALRDSSLGQIKQTAISQVLFRVNPYYYTLKDAELAYLYKS